MTVPLVIRGRLKSARQNHLQVLVGANQSFLKKQSGMVTLASTLVMMILLTIALVINKRTLEQAQMGLVTHHYVLVNEGAEYAMERALHFLDKLGKPAGGSLAHAPVLITSPVNGLVHVASDCVSKGPCRDYGPAEAPNDLVIWNPDALARSFAKNGLIDLAILGVMDNSLDNVGIPLLINPQRDSSDAPIAGTGVQTFTVIEQLGTALAAGSGSKYYFQITVKAFRPGDISLGDSVTKHQGIVIQSVFTRMF